MCENIYWWPFSFAVILSKSLKYLNCPLRSHIYLHKVKYQRRLKCSERMASLDKLGKINVTHRRSAHFQLNVELRFRSPEDYVKTAPDAICQSEPPLGFRHPLWERERATELRLYADAIPVCLGTAVSCISTGPRTGNSTVSKWTNKLLSFVHIFLLYVLKPV